MICVDSFSPVLGEGTSKGNQHKFYNKGYWIKLDGINACEGLAEELVSLIEGCILDFSYVRYKTDLFSYNEVSYRGCISYNMYNRLDTSFISLRNLFRQHHIPLNIFVKDEDICRNIMSVVNTVVHLTGLNIFPYLSRLLLLDCIIQNEDRHIMNLGVCYCSTDNKYYEAPCFDNGSSLFCVPWTYRRSKTLEQNIKSARSVARPFSKFYDKQLDAILALGGQPLRLNRRVLIAIDKYASPIYSYNEVNLAKSTLLKLLDYYNERAFVYV